jgi:hypothetical protein
MHRRRERKPHSLESIASIAQPLTAERSSTGGTHKRALAAAG